MWNTSTLKKKKGKKKTPTKNKAKRNQRPKQAETYTLFMSNALRCQFSPIDLWS